MKVENNTPELKKPWSLYILRCADNSLYCGITTDLDRRFQEHQSMGKKTAKYLRGRGPLQLVFHQEIGEHSLALKTEMRIKALDKASKEHLVGSQSLDIVDAIC